mmetsp:Transcript_35870/g.80830  ORF Transcript_35870/g.80830 Transcript_35870/m.80830 type:complete len:345 (+) Transcript_35870:572-1606(+)
MVKAGKALKIELDHLDRPAGLYAVYSGKGGAGVVSDFCAKHLHTMLFARLARYLGRWDVARLTAALEETLDELEVEAPLVEEPDAASIVLCLAVGANMFVTGFGEGQAVVVRVVKGRALEELATRQSSSEASGTSLGARLAVHHGEVSDSQVVVLSTNVLPGDKAAEFVLSRGLRRPKAVSASLLGERQDDSASSSVVAVSFSPGTPQAAPAGPEPPAKRPRSDAPREKVRCRQLLLKHCGLKHAVDNVRRKPVVRTREQAEAALAALVPRLLSDVDKEFPKVAREVSESQEALKGGDQAGDMGWLARGKMPKAFDDVAFALKEGEVSDVFVSELGVHILQRRG